MYELDEVESNVVSLVAQWVDEQVRPTVNAVEHSGGYPTEYVEAMKEMGVFGLCVPQPWGSVSVSVPCFALVTAQLARGWMSLAGVMGSHSVIAKLLVDHGTDEQRDRYLPRMASGELRAAMALTEPGGGSDLQAMRTTARLDGSELELNGSKTWISNARKAGLIAVLCKTDPRSDPPHAGMSVVLVEAGTAGLTVSRDLPKLGYRGVESCEIAFDGCRVPATAILGSVAGKGFAQMMHGLELGRVQVAARALGVAQAAYDDALRYSQEREAFGVPIWRHQSVGNYLADMAVKVQASRLLILDAADRVQRGERADLEAGIAKLYASEAAMQICLDALRVHGGNGYSTEFNVERYFRDAPLMIIGEGTNEIQRNVIVRQIVDRASRRGARPPVR